LHNTVIQFWQVKAFSVSPLSTAQSYCPVTLFVLYIKNVRCWSQSIILKMSKNVFDDDGKNTVISVLSSGEPILQRNAHVVIQNNGGMF
jgi:hypothetical protein